MSDTTTAYDPDQLEWRCSSHAEGDARRVELAIAPDDSILLRNSGTGEIVRYTRHEIDAFLQGAKAGEFDSSR
jgi:hypothetical protein